MRPVVHGKTGNGEKCGRQHPGQQRQIVYPVPHPQAKRLHRYPAAGEGCGIAVSQDQPISTLYPQCKRKIGTAERPGRVRAQRLLVKVQLQDERFASRCRPVDTLVPVVLRIGGKVNGPVFPSSVITVPANDNGISLVEGRRDTVAGQCQRIAIAHHRGAGTTMAVVQNDTAARSLTKQSRQVLDPNLILCETNAIEFPAVQPATFRHLNRLR